jgi:hypothetical protein
MAQHEGEVIKRKAGRTSHRADDHDRCDLSQSAPHGIQPAGKKGDLGRLMGRTKGGMNTKLHAVTEANGRPISFFMTEGQVTITLERPLCWTVCPKPSGCWATGI